MNRWAAIALLALLIPVSGVAQQKSKKKTDVPSAFQYAHSIYVEAVDGDAMKPGLYPADRQAIFDVQDALSDWDRYAIANKREQADIVLVVRKGRIASGGAATGVPVGLHPPGSQTAGQAPGHTQGQPGDEGNVGNVEVGPENDTLRVYLLSGDGKLAGPVWTRSIQDGLDAPAVVLVQQLRTAVERAYPGQPPPAKPTP